MKKSDAKNGRNASFMPVFYKIGRPETLGAQGIAGFSASLPIILLLSYKNFKI